MNLFECDICHKTYPVYNKLSAHILVEHHANVEHAPVIIHPTKPAESFGDLLVRKYGIELKETKNIQSQSIAKNISDEDITRGIKYILADSISQVLKR